MEYVVPVALRRSVLMVKVCYKGLHQEARNTCYVLSSKLLIKTDGKL